MFKKGDKVVCVDGSDTRLVEVGETYTVIADQCNDYVHLDNLNGGMYAARFKLVEDKPSPAYEVGDFVRILHTDYDQLKVGDVAKVIGVDGSGVDLECGRTPSGLYFYFNEVEPYVEETITVDEVLDALGEEEPKQPLPSLTIQLGQGLGIVLDPNVPFSRKFADAFLDVVYGSRVA